MFTGIITGLGEISSLKQSDSFLRYAVRCRPEWVEEIKIGASVAINGVCQTVTKQENEVLWFDAIEETLEKTTLKNLTLGSKVNVERAMRYGDEIGGHLMSGHVVGFGKVKERIEEGENLSLLISVNAEWMRFILEKGFIGIDGASLTVGKTEKDSLWLHLIPETRQLTTLGFITIGDEVNIEIDAQTQAIVTTVENFLHFRLPAENMSNASLNK